MHEAVTADAFMMCVVNVPGKTPIVLTTPKVHVDPALVASLPGALGGMARDLAEEVAEKLGVEKPQCPFASNFSPPTGGTSARLPCAASTPLPP